MLVILIRTVIIYFAAVFSLRFMGKRQVGEMQLSELTTAVLLSELLASPAVNPDIPLLYGIVPLIVLICLEVLVSYGVNKSKTLGNIFDNRPSLVIDRGNIDQKELSKLRFGLSELVSELRQKDIGDIKTVDYAFLEPNGKVSVFEKGAGLCFSVICDGELCKEAMSAAGVDEKFVKNELRKCGKAQKDVFLMTVGQSGVCIIDKEKSK